jgi:hypothetical protein
MSALDFFLPLAKVVHTGGFTEAILSRRAGYVSLLESAPFRTALNKERTFS